MCYINIEQERQFGIYFKSKINNVVAKKANKLPDVINTKEVRKKNKREKN